MHHAGKQQLAFRVYVYTERSRPRFVEKLGGLFTPVMVSIQ